MTAEIGVLNKYGVALAADSAVTIGSANNKILNSANKLFMLSKHHPVGIMVYQGASFMEIPWETLIKLYRKELDNRSFNELKGYCNDFINFIKLTKYVELNTEKMLIFNHTCNLTEYLKYKENVSGELTEEKYLDIIKRFHEIMMKSCFVNDFNEDDYTALKLLKDEIVEDLANHFEKNSLNFSKDTLKLALDCAILSLLKSYDIENIFGNYSGIVIAGFGDDEVFPRLGHYKFYSKINGKLKIFEEDFEEISCNNASSINPFAQSEEVLTFIKGISPKVQQKLEAELSKTFLNLGNLCNKILEKDLSKSLSQDEIDSINKKGEVLFNKLLEDTERQRSIEYITPVLTMLRALPKEDLGFMAETLVSLTSFKRRLSTDAETVGGPIDVAVITKGDGFIWLKRKHYFNARENQHFFNNYFKCIGGEDE